MAKILQWGRTKDAPVCCHEGADEHNLGYTKLMLRDGTPAEAELFCEDDRITLSVIMPVFRANHKWTHSARIYGERNQNGKTKQIGYFRQDQKNDYSILSIGMVDDGCENDIDVISEYVEYLAEMDVFHWTGNLRDGSVEYLYDVEGHELVSVKITVEENGQSICEVVPKFQKFDVEGL